MRLALAGSWPPAQDHTAGELALVCTPNLDVYSGLAGPAPNPARQPARRRIAQILDGARAHGRQTDDALWFGSEPLPEPAELAARYGDATGLGVHPGPDSVRYLWLDRAQQQTPAHHRQAGRHQESGHDHVGRTDS